MKTNLYDRQESDIAFDLHYYREYSMLCRMYYSRISTACSILNILCGPAVVCSIFSNNSLPAVIIGVFITIANAYVITVRPETCSIQCGLQQDNWVKLIGDAANMTGAEVEQQIAELNQKAVPDVYALSDPAYNIVCDQQGLSNEKRRIGLIPRLKFWVASC